MLLVQQLNASAQEELRKVTPQDVGFDDIDLRSIDAQLDVSAMQTLRRALYARAIVCRAAQ
jgi:hypothetical protein